MHAKSLSLALALALTASLAGAQSTIKTRKRIPKKSAPSAPTPSRKAPPEPRRGGALPRAEPAEAKPEAAAEEDAHEAAAQAAEQEHAAAAAETGTLVSPSGALGAALVDSPAGPAVGEPLSDSPAESLGLKAGDRVYALAGKPTPSAGQPAASALSSWPLGARLSAVVARGLEVRRLEASAPPAPSDRGREKDKLSAHELAIKQGRLDASGEAAAAALRAAPPLDFSVHARQAFWLRFPNGVRADVAPGAIFVGETTTAVTTSPELDFLSLPPKSLVWARVLSIERTGDLRKLRLHVFKLKPAGGHAYRVSGLLTDIVGDQKLAKVSTGGTLVASAPLAPLGKKEVDWLIAPETRLRGELLDALTLTEEPNYYRAGPGLWLRTKDAPQGRRFEISHVIPGRAAEKAGLKVGQLVSAVGARSSEKLDFAEALDTLYGEPGSQIKLTVEKEGAKPETVALRRGVLFKDGKEEPVPLPVK